MKQALLSITLLLIFIQLRASDTLTVRQVYSFSVGDTFDYRQTYANYDIDFFTTLYSRVVINQKYVSPLQDTFIYNNNWVITNLDSIAAYVADSTISAPYCQAIFFDTSSFWGFNSNAVKDCNDDGFVYAYFTDSLGETDGGNSMASNLDGGYYNNTQETKLVYFSDGQRKFGTPYYILAGINQAPNNTGIQVFPNPANNIITLSLGALHSASYQWLIYDILGSQVQTCNIKNTLTTLAVSNLSKGIYTWKVLENGATIMSGKFVKQ